MLGALLWGKWELFELQGIQTLLYGVLVLQEGCLETMM